VNRAKITSKSVRLLKKRFTKNVSDLTVLYIPSSTNSPENIWRMFKHSQNRMFAEYSSSKDLNIRRTLHEPSANFDLKGPPNHETTLVSWPNDLWVLVVRIPSKVLYRAATMISLAFSLLSSFYSFYLSSRVSLRMSGKMQREINHFTSKKNKRKNTLIFHYLQRKYAMSWLQTFSKRCIDS